MKTLHRPDLYCWSRFDEARNVDFNSVLWSHHGGGVIIDPMPLSWHDVNHMRGLGPVAWIVVTNSDHVRASEALAELTGAKIAGPAGERGAFVADRWLEDGEELVPGLVALELQGSKTPGELALLLEETTLITGDLVRSHSGGTLVMLPDAKLADKDAAKASVARLAALPRVEAVLVGDGWPVFRDGRARLQELASR